MTDPTPAPDYASPPEPADLDWLRFPERRRRQAPCQQGCPSGSDIRQWIALVAQRDQLGLTRQEAYRQAWETIVATNPFPACMGRICPHPCQNACNRGEKDGVVQINALERFLGDWALASELPLPGVADVEQPESIGVVGAGPAGLSFAYQMRRLGYDVTVYESAAEAGGMLRYGIPAYRLPKDVLRGEIQRIIDLGVSLQLGVSVGRDISFADLRHRHAVVFLGIGAQSGRLLGLAGEAELGVFTGVDYLARRNRQEAPAIGPRVIVVGGGNTAIDAARAALRDGAQVTLVYRRTRAEMPAIAAEVDEALAEGVRIEFLASPVALRHAGGRLTGLRLERMALGQPDTSGRRAPVPLPDSDFELAADTLIAAISQQPDLAPFPGLPHSGAWLADLQDGYLLDGVWAGGDVSGLGLATLAIGHGRQAAERLHARLRGLPASAPQTETPIDYSQLHPEHYPEQAPTALPHAPPDRWQAEPDAEVAETLAEPDFVHEASRCMSCGQCMGCELCTMYCSRSGYLRLDEVRPGAYFALLTDRCEGCGKCIELCPCGFIQAGRLADSQ